MSVQQEAYDRDRSDLQEGGVVVNIYGIYNINDYIYTKRGEREQYCMQQSLSLPLIIISGYCAEQLQQHAGAAAIKQISNLVSLNNGPFHIIFVVVKYAGVFIAIVRDLDFRLPTYFRLEF